MPIWTGAVNNNWNNAGNWSVDGLGNTGVPTASTDAIFNSGSSVNCTINTINLLCRDLTTTGYTGTITVNFGLSVTRNLVIGSSTVITGTGFIVMTGTGNLDIPVAYVLPNLLIDTTGTITLIRSTSITNLRRNVAGTGTITAGSAMTITINNGSYTHTNGTIAFASNVTLNFTGTSTINSTSMTGNMTLVSGTLTMTGTCTFGVGTVNLSAGTFVAGTSNYSFNAATHTLITGTNQLNNLSSNIFGFASTLTITSNLFVNNLNIIANINLTISGAFDIYVAGTLGNGVNCGLTTSNRTVFMTGSSGSSSITSSFSTSVTNTTIRIDCGSSTFTINGGLRLLGSSSLIYVNSGTLSLLGASLQLSPTATVNMGNVHLNGANAWGATEGWTSGCSVLSDMSFINVNPGVGCTSTFNLYARNLSITNVSITVPNATVILWNDGQNSLITSTIGVTMTFFRLLIQKGANTVTFGNASQGIVIQNALVDYVSGIVTQGIGASITFNNCTLNLNGAIFNQTVTCQNTTTLTSLLEVSGTLITAGTTRFQGTAGFRTNILNIATNTVLEAGITYSVYGNLTMIGTAAARRDLRSSQQAVFVGTASGTTLTRSSGAVPTVGMTLGGNLNTAIPTGLGNLLPNRPVINGGVNPNFTLDLSVTPTTGNVTLIAGNKAILILENNPTSSQNVAYVTCQDIDSSAGKTILALGSVNDNAGVALPNIYRTLNWGELIAPNTREVDAFVG
jgi:hypothetical protein